MNSISLLTIGYADIIEAFDTIEFCIYGIAANYSTLLSIYCWLVDCCSFGEGIAFSIAFSILFSSASAIS